MTTKKFTLPNGVTVITTKMAEAKSTSLIISVPHGSRHETEEQAGLAHFFEHLVFKGAKKYPTPEAISEALDQYGAYYNAFTDFEQTAYLAQITAEHFDTALDVISDYLTHPKLKQSDIDRERNVILEEFNMYWDVPKERADMQSNKLVFGDSPLGRSIIGYKNTIAGFKRADFVNWHEHYYGSDKVVVGVAGVIPHNLEAMLKKALKDLPKPAQVKMVPATILDGEPRILMDVRKGDQIQLNLSFPSIAASDRRQPVLQLLRAIMGSSMSSRLFREVREKRGLCYSIYMSNQYFSDTGMIQVVAGLDRQRLAEAVAAIWLELKKIANEAVPAAELKRAKEYIKGATILGVEDNMSVAKMMTSQYMFEGTLKSVEEKLAEIERVKASEITKLANELFVANKIGLVLVGPKQNTDQIREIVTS